MVGVLTGISVLQSVTDVFSGPSPDDERFAKTAAWYRDALAGDQSDYCRLKYYSGRFGSHDCGTGIISGWATQAAKDYSYLLYNQATAVFAGQLPKTTPVPSPASSVPAVANTLATISSATGTAAAVLGAPTVQQQQLETVTNIGKWILIGGLVLVVGYLVFRARR